MSDVFLRALLCLIAGLSVAGCKQQPQPSGTLGDLDISSGRSEQKQAFVSPRSEAEIRAAYLDYLDSASVDERMRIDALSRMAQLEYASSKRFLADKDNSAEKSPGDEEIEYQQRLDNTIELLTTALSDYPDAPNNDVLLYQLAKAQAQNDQHDASIASLQQLADNFARSRYYTEAQFRIAEDAFANQDYASAEYAYSEVVYSSDNAIFYEKSLFKRGWSRFKQQYYLQAIDDFLQAVKAHGFAEYEKLTAAEREQFDEYFRAIALSFSYLDDTSAMDRYFQAQPEFRYIYFVYDKLAEMYLEQERYSDAVKVHHQFIGAFSTSENIPYSRLKIIEIWKQSGFTRLIYQPIEDFYRTYNPASSYWQNQNENSRVNRVVRRSLKEYVILMTGYYHNRYQRDARDADFNNAEKWYQRYLEHYAAYARQDRIYFLYAELLASRNRLEEADRYYRLAAWDDQIIVDQDAAYASLVITNQHLNQQQQPQPSLVEAYLDQSILYRQQFAKDARSATVALSAAELGYNHGRLRRTVVLTDLLLESELTKTRARVTSLKADAYFQLGEFAETEALYTALLQRPDLDRRLTADIKTKLTLAIYKQGEQAAQQGHSEQAIEHYARIARDWPRSQHAPTGLYDAIALQMQHGQWAAAIDNIERFQHLYPDHRLRGDLSKKLSVAYLNSNQGIKAAREFERIARQDQDDEIRAAAIWQAAELYKEKNQHRDAIRSFKTYLDQFPRPYDRRLVAMTEVSDLYTAAGDPRQASDWLKKLVGEDETALNNVKTEQTRLLVSTAYLKLARMEKQRFDRLQLSLPLKRSLANKKAAMQNAVNWYGQASANRIYVIVTEATHSIASIYQQFSEALLNSDRPSGLSPAALDQYEILLEDQAFPFQDKAIEFYEINLARIGEGLYNDWIASSHQQLIKLFPLRYDRYPRRDKYYAELE